MAEIVGEGPHSCVIFWKYGEINLWLKVNSFWTSLFFSLKQKQTGAHDLGRHVSQLSLRDMCPIDSITK